MPINILLLNCQVASNVLKTIAPDTLPIKNIREKYDKDENDAIDTSLLNEVFSGRVDLLISEDRKIHKKASEIGVSTRVFTIDSFLEKVVAENPNLAEYKVLAVRKRHFGEIDINDTFFDSFKRDYVGFEKWFNKKADEIAYVCDSDEGHILAFLFVKLEDQNENYSDIAPQFSPKRRLKIGTFKVISNGYKLGERFLKIIFDNALLFDVEEVYVTIFDRTEDQERLIQLLTDWGFYFWGYKHTASGKELVYVRDFSPTTNIDNPCMTYPYFSSKQRKFIVPIKPKYHTELFPDSILRTESPKDFVENRPNRNAISKVYVTRAIERNLHSGDVLVFYRSKDKNAGFFTSVTTTIGVVQNIVTNIRNSEHLIQLCRKRSVFSDQDLIEYWNEKPTFRPFVVNFIYIYSFPKRLILRDLMQLNIIQEAPRGISLMSDKAFETLLEYSHANKRIVVD